MFRSGSVKEPAALTPEAESTRTKKPLSSVQPLAQEHSQTSLSFGDDIPVASYSTREAPKPTTISTLMNKLPQLLKGKPAPMNDALPALDATETRAGGVLHNYDTRKKGGTKVPPSNWS